VMTEPGQLEVDGEAARAVINANTTLNSQVGKLYPGADVTVTRSGQRPVLHVVTPSEVTVIADGNRTAVSTTQLKSGRVLADAAIPVGKNDRVTVKRPTPRPATGFGDGATIRVTRVTYDVSRKTRTTEPRTVTRKDPSLDVGTTRTATAGAAGKQRIRVTKVIHDGVLRRTVTKVLSTRPARDRVIVVGSKQPAPANDDTIPSSGGLNWAALAKCESGGNPKALNPAGYYGLYQFNLGTWASVGGKGKPTDASAAEQTLRAQKLYDSRGRSPWPHCGKYL
jgi:uncharacterized protein YabE (DUF348 family)